MKLLATVRVAVDVLESKKMRWALSMLGIISGGAAVIAMVGVGSGATARIDEQIQSIGSNVIIVLSGSITSGGIRLGSGASQTLSEDDAAAIAADCPAVEATSGAVRGSVQIVYGNNNWATSIQGVTPEYLSIRDYSVDSGRAFTSQDVDAATKVALLGPTVANNLFGDADPVGQLIRIKNVPFTVSGVLSRQGQSPTGQDQYDVILMPLSTAKRKVLGSSQANLNSVSSIIVQARGPQMMKDAEQQVADLLPQRHRLPPT